MPSEIQYVGVLIKSASSDCELLKRAYLKLACLIGRVCLSARLLCTWASLFGSVRVRIAVIICVNRGSAGSTPRAANRWHVYSFVKPGLFSLLFPPSATPATRMTRARRWRLTSEDFTHARARSLISSPPPLASPRPILVSHIGHDAACSFQSMSAKGSKSRIKVRRGSPFCMLPGPSSHQGANRKARAPALL